METAAILAEAAGIYFEIAENLHENDRSTTGFLPPDAFEAAADQFRALLAQYPTHDKAAGALLKLGLCDYGQGKLPEAERTLAEVVAKYPGTDVARTADDRLRAIQLGRLR